MRRLGRTGAVISAVAVAAAIFVGCTDRQPVEVNTIEDFVEKPAPPEPPSEEQAAEIVAEVTHVAADSVEIVDQAAAGDMLTIDATIPAHEKMLPHHAAAPDTGGGVETEQRIEWVTVRWHMATERPTDITWSERLQFAEQEPIAEDEALQAAEELKDEWFPEVPVEMALQPPRLLNRPVWALVWRGETGDEVLTGDQVAVQVSALTGLPIAYSQRVAPKRPSPDEIELTREEAIEEAREELVRRGEENLADTSLVARLVLSAPAHPEGGPAWLVRGTGEQAALMIPIDAMNGDVLAGERSSDGE